MASAGRTSTALKNLTFGSSVRRLASTQPAEPAPTTTWCEHTPLSYKERDVLKVMVQLKHCLQHASAAVTELSDKPSPETEFIDRMLKVIVAWIAIQER